MNGEMKKLTKEEMFYREKIKENWSQKVIVIHPYDNEICMILGFDENQDEKIDLLMLTLIDGG